MLNRLRTHIRGNPLLSEDLKALSDMSYDETPIHAKTFLHIFPTNKEVDRHNEEMINRTCQPVFSSMAKDYFRNITTGEIKQRETPYSSTTSEDLQMVVKIGIGARIMLTRNLDTDDGLVNGAFGTITAIDNTTTTNITAVYVKFDNAKIGLKCQKKTVVDRAKKGSVRIQPIEETLRGKQVTRKQFPFKLGWAATIHKVQGMTVANIVISMKKIFQSGMAYVALSRATSTTGLYIINFDPNTIYSSEDITDALQKMPSFLQLSNEEITTNTTDGLQFIHHNTEGILPHVADIKCNTAIQDSDIICFTETWMKANTKIPKSLLPKHKCHQLLRRDAYEAHRKDFNSLAEKDRGGVSIFVRSDIPHSRLHFSTNNIEAVACVLEEPIMIVLSIYRPPSYSVTLFKQTLTEVLTEIQSKSMPTLVFGDFNENILKLGNCQILQIFNSFGYRQLVDKPTTESLTCLDLVFVNGLSDETSAIVVPTYYSFHDAVNVFVPFKK